MTAWDGEINVAFRGEAAIRLHDLMQLTELSDVEIIKRGIFLYDILAQLEEGQELVAWDGRDRKNKIAHLKFPWARDEDA